MFKALMLEEGPDTPTASVRELDDSALPDGEVTVAVEYSGLNYKDGMILAGRGGLVRHYPHVPGIDLAGTVTASAHADFQPGDRVVLTGWGVGERHWGGYAQKARVPADWLLPIPEGLSARHAMAVGTAGLAAALGILALEDHGLAHAQEPVLVTGASGGVGSLAVALLAQAGYPVTALTGSTEHADYLRQLGAGDVIDRSELSAPGDKPLEHQRWAGCVDAAGGIVLSRVLAQLQYGGSVAAVGLAGGTTLHTTLIPFLLRGVNLLGIDTVFCPVERRRLAWRRLARDLPTGLLDTITHDVALGDLPALGRRILEGTVRGRIVVDVNA